MIANRNHCHWIAHQTMADAGPNSRGLALDLGHHNAGIGGWRSSLKPPLDSWIEAWSESTSTRRLRSDKEHRQHQESCLAAAAGRAWKNRGVEQEAGPRARRTRSSIRIEPPSK